MLTSSKLESAIHCASGISPSATVMNGRYDIRILFNGAWRRVRDIETKTASLALTLPI